MLTIANQNTPYKRKINHVQGKEKIKKNALFLLDGSYYLYRSYFALPPLHTADGHPTQATFAFCRTIKKLINDFDPSYLATVWDTKGGSKRNKELHTEYKATRPEPPSDLFMQKDDILNFLDIVNIKNIVKPGYEADDLIGALAQDITDCQVVIVCPDKDMYQLLVHDHVVIVDPFKNRVVDRELYEQEKGFPPEKVIFYYSLLGDKSDNIPGVQGVGEKTAQKLLTQFDSLEDLYKNIDTVEKERTKKLLTEHKDDALMSEKLFTLDYHDLGITKEACSFDKNNWDNATDFFTSLELRALISKSAPKAETPQQQSLAPGNKALDNGVDVDESWECEIVSTMEQLDAMIANIEKAGYCGMDTETSGVLPLMDILVGLSFAYNTKKSYYIPLQHPLDIVHQQLPLQETLNRLKPLLSSTKIKKTLHNTKFDELVLYNYGIELKGVDFDTILAANLLRKAWQKVNLKDLSMQYLGEGMQKFKVVIGKKYKSFDQVPIAQAARYAAHDALQTLKLQKIFSVDIKKNKKLNAYLNEIDMPLYHLLVKMEKRGVAFDAKVLKNLEQKVLTSIKTVEDKIRATIPEEARLYNGEPINLGSPKQIEVLLFDHLKLPMVKKTRKGERSTDQEVLSELAKTHPLPGMLIQHREMLKLHNTYITPLPDFVNPKTGRIHTSYSQTMVVTGRLSSNHPNLQNIPVSGEYGALIREAFVAGKGHKLLSADYSQIELRVLAHLSQDKNLIEALVSGKDIHTQTAVQIFAIEADKVTNEQRQIGKRINFSIMYGLTPFGLSKDLDIPIADARSYIEKYFNQYPDVATWMDNVVEKAKKDGYVETLQGKRRYVPELYEKNKSRQNAGKRYAINTPVQGTSAEIMKIAMININKTFESKAIQAEIILQIHDEIIIEFAADQEEQVSAIVLNEMEHVTNWQVPLKVAIRTGLNWGEITK